MPEADEILPYHVFVPSTWDGKSPLPLVFVLHGNSRDQDFYFDRDGRIIPRTAEKHGYMVVAPLGYSPNGGYNYVPYGRPASGARGLAGASATPQTFGPAIAATDENAANVQTGRGGRGGPGNVGFGGVNGSVTPALVRSEWSEQDTMHVFDLIKREIPDRREADVSLRLLRRRTGRSLPRAEVRRALGSHRDRRVERDAGRHLPVCTTQEHPDDDLRRSERHRKHQHLAHDGSSPARKRRRGHPQRVRGANHDSAPSAATADIFAFFDAHPRK